jgi:hypothetical protein
MLCTLGWIARRDTLTGIFCCGVGCLQVRPCDLALGSEVVGSGSLVMGLQPNSTIAHKLDEAMLKLAESGQVPGEARYSVTFDMLLCVFL